MKDARQQQKGKTASEGDNRLPYMVVMGQVCFLKFMRPQDGNISLCETMRPFNFSNFAD